LVGTSVTCLPGKYILTYSITNDDGATATATRAVIVYSAGQLSLQLPLYENLNNNNAASQTVQALSNASSVEAAAAANSIARRLSPNSASGLGVQASDVSILQAQLVQLGPSIYSVQVDAQVYVYYPSSVHRGDITHQAAASKLTASSSVRRAILGVTEDVLPTIPAAKKQPVQRRAPTADELSAGIQAMVANLRQLAAAVTAEGQSVQAQPKHAAGQRGRRLLQVADTGIAAQLASMASAASRSLGQVYVTSQQTSAAVDPVVVSASNTASGTQQCLQAVPGCAHLHLVMSVPLSWLE
jgi:hypothetical protein